MTYMPPCPFSAPPVASALTSKEGQDAHGDDALAAGAAGKAQGDKAWQATQQHTSTGSDPS